MKKSRRFFRLPLGVPGQLRREVDEELAFHLDMRTEELVREGMCQEEARAKAVGEFGSLEEASKRLLDSDEAAERSTMRIQWRDELRQDLRQALRGLWRAPAFSVTAVLTLAVGIGGVSVMFALIHGVLLRPLPVQDQERVVVAWKDIPATGFLNYPYQREEVESIARESRLLQGVAGSAYWGASPWVANEDGEASYMNGSPVTGDFFEVLGVEPVLGRALDAGDDVSGAENVLVIGHSLWQSRYGGEPDVIGRRLSFQGQTFTLVGVMAPEFEYPRGAEAWMTGAAYRTTVTDPAYGALYFLVGRLRPGATPAQLDSELQAFIREAEARAPVGAPTGTASVVRSFEEVVVGDVRPAMLLLFGAVGLVLLIAGANVANLLLMRGEARRPEFALRSALGAGRWRIARQVVQESLVLSLAAGAAGLLVTWASLQLVLALVPGGLPRIDSIRVDGAVALFTLFVACGAAALAALAPAFSSARVDPAMHLSGGGRGVVSRGRRGRRTLVVAQVGLAVMVVAGAGLVTRSLVALQTVEMGIDTERLAFVELALPQGKYDEREPRLHFLDALVAEIEGAPGIAGATPVNSPPYSGSGGWDAPLFTVEGQDAEAARSNPSLNLESVHPGYFSTFQVALLRGRAFTDADRDEANEVVVVSEDVAERAWPGEDPIGRRLKLGGPDTPQPWRTVVGVARPTRYRELVEPRPTLYLPARQFTTTARMIAVRTSAPVEGVADLVGSRIDAVDPDVKLMRVASFDDFLAAPLARPRFNAFLLGLFGVTALLLAAIGLYAVMGTYVRQRRREIGVRMALGATAGNVRRLVLSEGLLLAGLGAGLGLAGAVVASRLLSGLLFDVHPLDPASMFAAAAILMGVSALASWIPARQAVRGDPAEALRAE